MVGLGLVRSLGRNGGRLLRILILDSLCDVFCMDMGLYYWFDK